MYKNFRARSQRAPTVSIFPPSCDETSYKRALTKQLPSLHKILWGQDPSDLSNITPAFKHICFVSVT